MKTKIIGLIACFAITAFAQAESEEQTMYQQGASLNQSEKVQTLIKSGLKKNLEEIQKESSSLSLDEKDALYKKNRKKAAAAWAAIDFGAGFGIGSYIQGDIGFGITQSVLDGISYGALFMAVTENDDDVQALQLATFTILFTTSRIMSWIFPFVHQSSYNKKLKAALNFDNNLSYSIEPLIIPKEGMPAVGVAFNLLY